MFNWSAIRAVVSLLRLLQAPSDTAVIADPGESSTSSRSSQSDLDVISEFVEVTGRRTLELMQLLDEDNEFAVWDNENLLHQAKHLHSSVTRMSATLSKHLDAFHDSVCHAHILLTDIFASFSSRTPRHLNLCNEYYEFRERVFEDLERLLAFVERARDNWVNYLKMRGNWTSSQEEKWQSRRFLRDTDVMAVALMDWTVKLQIRLTATKVVQGYWSLIADAKETVEFLSVTSPLGQRLSSVNPVVNMFA